MDKRIEELIPFYAMDALTEEERALVEAYLEDHPEVEAQIRELKIAASALPYSARPVEPSDRPKRELFERVAVDSRAHPSSGAGSPLVPRRFTRSLFGTVFPRFALSGLSLLVAILAVAWVVWLNIQVSRLQAEVAALRGEINTQRISLEQASLSLEQIRQSLAEATPSGLVTINLSGTDLQPQAHGQLIADPGNNLAVLAVADLSPLPADQVYQVWLIEGDSPTSAGLLHLDDQGQGLMILNSDRAIGTFDALGVSIEPGGGSLQPSGEIVILSMLF